MTRLRSQPGFSFTYTRKSDGARLSEVLRVLVLEKKALTIASDFKQSDMPSLLRLDSIAGDPLQWEKINGRYFVHLKLGEVGHPLTYYSLGQNNDIITRTEVVSEEGLFNDRSLKSLPHVPILATHPKARRYYGNREKLKVGQLDRELSRTDTELTVVACIDDADSVGMIDQLRADKKDVLISPSYDLVRLDRQGDHFVQYRDIYDHIAGPLLPGVGRGGSNIRMRFDSVDADLDLSLSGPIMGADPDHKKTLYFYFNRSDEQPKTPEAKPMTVTPFSLNGQSFNTEDSNLVTHAQRTDSLIADLRQQVDQAKQQLGAEQAKTADLTQRMDSVTTGDGLNAVIAERVGLWTKAEPIIQSAQPQFRADYGMNPADVMTLAVAIARPDLKQRLDSIDLSKPEGVGFLKAMFEMLPAPGTQQQQRSDSLPAGTSRVDSLMQLVNMNRADSNPGVLPGQYPATQPSGYPVTPVATYPPGPGQRLDANTAQDHVQRQIEAAGANSWGTPA